MDMQKERDLLKKYDTLDDDLSDREDLGRCEKWFLMGYREALKSHAVPDGYCIVPKEPTAKMIDATWDCDDEIQNMSHNARNEFIYKAMIEAAQEQS